MQPPLLAPTGPMSREGDPTTSVDAANSLTLARLSELQGRVLDVISANPDGLTDEEVVARIPTRRGPTIIKRRSELFRAGLVADSGQRRSTSSGRAAIVWVAA